MKTRILLIFFFAFQYATARQHDQAGTYQFDINPVRIFSIAAEADSLYFSDNGKVYYNLKWGTDGRYVVDKVKPEARIQFLKGKMIVSQGGTEYSCQKLSDDPAFPHAKSVSNRQNGFTRADSLRGKLTPLRDCYDVKYYHLTADIKPGLRSIDGNVLIRFQVVKNLKELQIDLYENMQIDSIIYDDTSLNYSREYDAVFVKFPELLAAGSTTEFRVFYHGEPQQPDQTVSMNGGVLWRKDAAGKDFAQVVCQGSGASLWWPNKDHLSDEADSTLITIIVPRGLQNISNGRLRRTEELPGNRTLTEWFVSYPINNYNVTFNIGDYKHLSDSFGALTLDYYFLPEHQEHAKHLFAKVKPMLVQLEKYFGRYPFLKDGFKLIETVYAMEHQSAVALGPFNGDSAELERLMWHEVSHEWWGNNVSMKDFADFWLHEGFAVYTEKLMYNWKSGPETALKSILAEKPANREPMIGEYNVNHVFYDLGDQYAKGCRLIHTIRSVVDNDSLFFSIIKGIQCDFAYQTVTSADIEKYISSKAGIDFSAVFDQYLRTVQIPEFTYYLENRTLHYKWSNTVKGFNMPVKVQLASKRKFQMIRPTDQWQRLSLKYISMENLKVDTANFYITKSGTIKIL